MPYEFFSLLFFKFILRFMVIIRVSRKERLSLNDE